MTLKKIVHNHNRKHIKSNTLKTEECRKESNEDGIDQRYSKSSKDIVTSTKHNSPLQDLLNPHKSPMRNIFYTLLIISIQNSVLNDLFNYTRDKKIQLGFRLITETFDKFDIVLINWICMQMAGIFLHQGSKIWTKYRTKSMNMAFVIMFIIFQSLYFLCITISVFINDLPCGSTTIILVEMVRIVMKNHSFIRETWPRVMSNDISCPSAFPSLSSYVYFLFAPTLIYREKYSRTKRTNWRRVLAYISEIIAIFFLQSYLIEIYAVSSWEKFGIDHELKDFKHAIFTIMSNVLPGMFILMVTYYQTFHCWMNLFAELLTFADRQFYMEWWNQSNFSDYYIQWNIFVHEWLHRYIYVDVLKLTGNRIFSIIFTFVISAVIHEFLLGIILRVFYPIFFINLGITSVILWKIANFKNRVVGNVFLLWSITVGSGIAWNLYCVEFYARYNCPRIEENYFLDVLIPRSWFC